MNTIAQIGYCGNVHPAVTVDQLIENLRQHTAVVKQLLGSDQPMPFGIWISARALEQLQTPQVLSRLKNALAEHQLVPFTVNGFPFGDFHQAVVKRSVYSPDWSSSKRLAYTLQLADLHHQLLPPDAVSTISTLPLGWPSESENDGSATDAFLKKCAENLATCAAALDQRYQQTGRRHIICIEPEPGCVLDCCGDVVEFFERYLFPHNSQGKTLIQNYIGVCHDVCHSAVMFESQEEAIAAYSNAGIKVGKVQVSSAVEVDFDRMDSDGKREARKQLTGFCEPKYLHQTSIHHADGERDFFVDLPDALEAKRNAQDSTDTGIWRVHFHVPIFYEGSAVIGTTQRCIGECLEAIRNHDVAVNHFEIETYAWPVLPEGIFSGSLDQGIAKEILYFKNLLSQEE